MPQWLKDARVLLGAAIIAGVGIADLFWGHKLSQELDVSWILGGAGLVAGSSAYTAGLNTSPDPGLLATPAPATAATAPAPVPAPVVPPLVAPAGPVLDPPQPPPAG